MENENMEDGKMAEQMDNICVLGEDPCPMPRGVSRGADGDLACPQGWRKEDVKEKIGIILRQNETGTNGSCALCENDCVPGDNLVFVREKTLFIPCGLRVQKYALVCRDCAKKIDPDLEGSLKQALPGNQRGDEK